MPIFISYNQRDKGFVDQLALNLIRMKHNVWMDRWELKVGDSITEKVENALTESSAVIVVVSQNSIDSGWCRRELSAALVREIEEKRSILLPCRIDDCEMPLFLRDKLYADFRTNPDKAIQDIDAALSSISNPYQNRFEEPEVITDWAVDWDETDGTEFMTHHFVDHAKEYVIVSKCLIACNEVASENFREMRKSGKTGEYIEHVLGCLDDNLEASPIHPPLLITDQFEQFVGWKLSAGEEEFTIVFTYRRMGKDIGFDTLVHLDNNIRQARQFIKEVSFSPDKDYK